MAFHLLSGLRAHPDVELSVIILNEGQLAHRLRKAGIATIVIDERENTFLQIVSLAAHAIRSSRPLILHSHRYKENLIAYLVALRSGYRPALVSTQHGMPEFYEGTPGLRNRIKIRVNYSLLSHKFHKTVAVSSDIKSALMHHHGFEEQHVETIRNGIAIPGVKLPTNPKDSFVIGSAGRFVPVKDYLFMVEIAKEVSKETDKIVFELAGEGPMLSRIEEAITRHGLESQFKLRGFMADIDMFYRGLDAYINTSIHEGVPMSVLEAMAVGLPAIAPRVGGLSEIVTDGIDGFLIEERSPSLFAKKCLTLYSDEKQRRRMSTAAREKIVSQFSVEQMVKEYLELYLHLLPKSNTQSNHKRQY